MAVASMTTDHTEQSYAYIEALTGSRNASVCWHPVHDKDKRLRCMSAHATLERAMADLRQRNGTGWGIFISVNIVAPGANREATNVVGIRALFIDQDKGTLRDPPLPPSFRVKSARGEHLYWVLAEGQPVDRFTAAQKHLAKYYGTDTTVSDLPRLMRVPGFMHNKGEPTLVTFAAGVGATYTIDQVLAAHPISAAEVAEVNRPVLHKKADQAGKWQAITMDERKRQAAAYLRGVPVAVAGEGGDRRTFQTCAIVCNDFAVEGLVDALEAMAEWNARCVPPWDESELARKVYNSARYSREDKGSRLTTQSARPGPPPPEEMPGWLRRGSR